MAVATGATAMAVEATMESVTEAEVAAKVAVEGMGIAIALQSRLTIYRNQTALVTVRARKELKVHRLDQLMDLFLDSTSALANEKKSIAELQSQYKNAQFSSCFTSIWSLREGTVSAAEKMSFSKPLERIATLI